LWADLGGAVKGPPDLSHLPKRRLIYGPFDVATSAPRSIFDAVKPESRPKVERASIDLSSVVIRTDVPLPPIRPGVAAIYPQLWERIPAGGMVELPDRQAHGLMAHVKKTGAKAAVRKLREGVKGVWRLA
jgi:hypothetical protein